MFKLGGKEYKVIAQLRRVARLMRDVLQQIYLRNARGKLVQLAGLIRWEIGGGPSAIIYFNRFRSTTIEGTPSGVSLGEAVRRTEEILQAEFPGLRFDWNGESSDLKESYAGFIFIAVLALLVVYMVLGSQFESLLHPLTIILMVPIAAVGAFGLLWAMNGVTMIRNAFYVGPTMHSIRQPLPACWQK